MIETSPLLSDSYFSRLKALVIEVTGMAFYADKDNDLALIVADRMTECGVKDCALYLERLQADSGEMEALVAELTIGETYFFRHMEQFQALRQVVLPDILERNAETRRLRIWSAGCATGPEPYTLAILLKREFGARIDGWHVSILGTDINQKFLTRAREGRYDHWAFRATPEEIRQQCFEAVGKQWQIKAEYKSLVSFQYHNLTQNRFPSIVDNIAGFDIIICRNVVIYFSPETVADLVPRFHDTLVEGGWLVMGHAEPSMDLFRQFRTVTFPGAVLFQRQDGLQVVPTPRPAVPFPPLTVPSRPKPMPRTPPAVRPAFVPASVAPAVDPPLEQLRALADQGRWDEALAACDQLLKREALDWRVHYLRALILDQVGDAEGCESGLRRAIYLERRAVMAHYHLGLFLQRKDEAEGARRSFRNVLTLLADKPEDTIVDEGETLTAGQLRETVGMHMKLLGASQA
ncbi:MAG: protein-glutamate O-methyltransferase CheR [Magnetospirillum sp.]|nr:protein-glutamate O-methyltransferase CheR [Magnetospirillum sp.]